MSDKELQLKRRALQLVGQLPEDTEDAREVLKYALELIDGWVVPRTAPTARRTMHSVALVRPPKE